MKKRKPNVLVAGFPKSGSTYLYHLLKQHPDIFIPKIKELNYFNKDHFFLNNPEILNPRYFKSRDWYFSFFHTEKKIVMDFSILSCMDASSARRAKALLGDIKILFIVRNKKDFLKSVKKFGEKEGKVWHSYEAFGDFEYYIRPYKEQFSNVMVLKLEDLNKSPKRELNKVIRFLNIKNFNFTLEMPRHKTEDYKMGPIQMLRRKVYFLIVKLFYSFISLTVRAKIKAQGEK